MFSEDIDINRILIGLSAISGQEIKEGKTLIFLDEVQDIPDVVAALKYFKEDAPEIFIVTAGSLLGVLNMEGKPFPSGKVDILHMFPMTYNEFIDALGESKLSDLLAGTDNEETINAILPKAPFHKK